MGTLVAMHYPTKLFLGAADHTYVMCGTGGKAWSCWGGKTGGSPLSSGQGSTNQADQIAEPNERAGVTCYLINGVCHQAANRILFPAGIFVTGARGYGVSSAIFGPYGRLKGPLGTCSAPFNKHTGVTGDLPECAGPSTPAVAPAAAIAPPAGERAYFETVSAAYDQAAPRGAQIAALGDNDLVEFMSTLFGHRINYRLGDRITDDKRRQLRDLHVTTERSRIDLENRYGRRNVTGKGFVAEFNRLVGEFQTKAAGTVDNADHYQALFDATPGAPIVLADPDITDKLYPD